MQQTAPLPLFPTKNSKIKYSGTPPCDHSVNTTTSLLQPLFLCPERKARHFQSYDQRPLLDYPATSRYFVILLIFLLVNTPGGMSSIEI